jgi:AraC-like DNA-binding protein
MSRESLYQPFEIVYKELETCRQAPRKHNFFELVYILKGAGKLFISDNHFNFYPGQLFLIPPADRHYFDILDTSQVIFIRFSNVNIKPEQQLYVRGDEWFKKINYILLNASYRPGSILFNATDKLLVKAVMDSILYELSGTQLYHFELIAQIVNTLITIVARNIALTLPEKVGEHTSDTIMNILNYVQENIHNSHDLRLDVISNHFNISEGYLGRYFKKHTGESLQQYIINYKLKLVETRLQHSDMRINEIVNELGFTDESHLNRLFKKYKGLNPSAFRKQRLQADWPAE